MNKKETVYQRIVVRRLESEYPGCFIMRNDPRYVQGVCDLLVLFNGHWAMLEVKASIDSPSEPNQEYYVDMFGRMSYASFVYPENEDQVFYELQNALCD